MFGLAGCTGASKENNSEKLQIVTTIFPAYDWVRSVLGKNPAGVEASFLLDSGVDLHSFQPSAEDILKISTCDVFIYVGGESDAWIDDVLKNAPDDLVVINLLDVLGDSVKEEEVVEGMQEEDEHEHGADGDAHEEEEETEYDEHVWLSLRNAEVLMGSISDAIQKLDPANAVTYQSNTEAYLAKLQALDGAYADAVNAANVKTLLFGDRFPFRYLVDDYGLSYYAAFVGCSAETEASFETITFLAGKVDELDLPAVLTIEDSDHRLAETIIQNTQKKDLQILTLDSMQATTAAEAQSTTYLSVMEGNLSVLKEALR